MNRVAQTAPPGDEALDALLGEYFKAEMPAVWPAFQPPRPRVLPFRAAAAPATKRPGLFLRSRLALAASVALLLLAAWMMPRGPVGLPGVLNLKRGDGSAGPRMSLPMKDAEGKDLLPPLPDLKELFPSVEGPKKGAEPNKVKSSLLLEQKDGKGSIRIDVEELPPNK